MIVKKVIAVLAFLLLGFVLYGISYEGWLHKKLNEKPQTYTSTSHRSVRSGGFHSGK